MYIINPYSLVTARIYYHFPDYPVLLQEFILQKYDKIPEYPEFTKFLQFWQDKIEGKLHSVVFATANLIEHKEIVFYANNRITIQ